MADDKISTITQGQRVQVTLVVAPTKIRSIEETTENWGRYLVAVEWPTANKDGGLTEVKENRNRLKLII